MQRRTAIVAAATFGLVFVGGGAATATAVSDDDGTESPDVRVTGTALEEASAAALEHVGGGEVVDSEVDGDAEGYYELEIRLSDGSVTEVNLGEDYAVLGDERGDDDANDAADD